MFERGDVLNRVYEYKVNQMIENFEILRKSFKWENDLISHLIALSFAMKKRNLDVSRIEDNKKYIKSETGAFSPFRGNMNYCLSGLIAAKGDNISTVMDRMLANAELGKKYGFKSQTFIPTAMYSLESVKDQSPEKVLSQAEGIYKEMRKNHPFLTGGDDYALAILLSASDHGTDQLEAFYDELNNYGFSKSNGLQMLSHIMALSGVDVSTGSNNCRTAWEYLKSNGYKVTSDYYPAIGLMTFLDDSEVLKDLVDIMNYLKKQKRYKWLGKGMNLLLASAIISSEWVDGDNEHMVEATLSVSIENIIIAQQVAMIAAVSAATAASAST